MPGVGLCACVLYLYAGSRGTVRVPGSNRHAVMGQGARVSMFNDNRYQSSPRGHHYIPYRYTPYYHASHNAMKRTTTHTVHVHTGYVPTEVPLRYAQFTNLHTVVHSKSANANELKWQIHTHITISPTRIRRADHAYRMHMRMWTPRPYALL
jgi:hypothetical protein